MYWANHADSLFRTTGKQYIEMLAFFYASDLKCLRLMLWYSSERVCLETCRPAVFAKETLVIVVGDFRKPAFDTCPPCAAIKSSDLELSIHVTDIQTRGFCIKDKLPDRWSF